jgi:hypothetical protein
MRKPKEFETVNFKEEQIMPENNKLGKITEVTAYEVDGVTFETGSEALDYLKPKLVEIFQDRIVSAIGLDKINNPSDIASYVISTREVLREIFKEYEESLDIILKSLSK